MEYWWNDADREIYSRTVLWCIAMQIHVPCAPYGACLRQYRKYVGFLVPAVGLSDLKYRRNGFENACIM
jgi:hypothetical protein